MAQQNVGDLETIRRNIEGWLQSALPDRPGLQIAGLNFPAASGESSVTLILDAESPQGGSEKYVLRMVPPTSEVFESHDLYMQFQMMQVMHAESIPAPPLVGYETDASLLGSDFYVMEFVDGQIPPDNPPMVFGSWVLDDLTTAQRTTMWNNGLGALAAIHRIDLDKHDFGRLPQARGNEPLVAVELAKFDSMFKPDLRATADPQILTAWNYLVENTPKTSQRGLCWGDSRVGNIIWRNLEPVAIIDWEMANIGDPLSDLAWWVWIDHCNSVGLGAEKIPGLPEATEIYADWQRQTGRSLDNIAYFELFTVVRYAIILELKFIAMKKANPDAGTIPNFVVPFIADLLDAAHQSR